MCEISVYECLIVVWVNKISDDHVVLNSVGKVGLLRMKSNRHSEASFGIRVGW